MEVVFTQDVPNKARAGEVRRVPDGYARNFLLPKGLAEVATPEVMKRIHKITAVGDEVRIRETAVMEELASALNDVTVTITARVTPTGRYYGTITSTHIAMELSEKVNREVDRRMVEIDDPIREPGEYDVVLRLSTEVTAMIHVKAEVEE
ncbi:MAG: 50S ribosomal protein L9 [SAR202 cluster bacterium]|nr:50S ribosomal protein L9 [SAR202 cluster bacterium]